MTITTKLVLLPVTAIALHYAITPPNARPPAEELREQGGPVERVIPYFTTFVKIVIWSWAALETSVLFVLSGHCPPVLARPVLYALFGPNPATPSALAALTTPTPAFVVGVLLSVTGSLLRAHTFRVLGSRFTFELSIRGSATRTPTPARSETHTLVTDGIYGIVRHPSYTGALLLALGFLLCLLDPASAPITIATRAAVSLSARCVESALARTALLACAWTTVAVVLPAGFHARMNKEDAMLEKHFGEAWRAWVGRVRWRLVPGVY